MDTILLKGKFMGFSSIKKTSKKGAEYTEKKLVVFIDDVGKLVFSFAGYAIPEADELAFSQAKSFDRITLHCGLDVGNYGSPVLVAKNWELD